VGLFTCPRYQPPALLSAFVRSRDFSCGQARGISRVALRPFRPPPGRTWAVVDAIKCNWDAHWDWPIQPSENRHVTKAEAAKACAVASRERREQEDGATPPTSKAARMRTTLETTSASHEKLKFAASIGRVPTNRSHVPLSPDHGPAFQGRHSADARIVVAAKGGRAHLILIGGEPLARNRARPASSQMNRSPRHLRPSIASSVDSELWPGIETEAEAEARDEDRADALWSRVPEVARKLARCDGDSRPCQLPICAVCTRLYRIDLYLQLRELAASCGGPHMIATIYLDRFPAGQLVKANLKREHDFLRKRFDRAGLTGSTLVGGTEVAWQAQHQRWLLHAHLLAIDVPKTAWGKLDKAWANSGTGDPIQTDELRDLGEQLSYLVKFHTYHKPGESRANRRARAYPLPRDRLVEFARWSSQYRLEDFLFVYGKRKRGRKIVER
jgi:hypothetical protein